MSGEISTLRSHYLRVLLGYAPGPVMATEEQRDAAFSFLTKCGLDPTEDAVGQLTSAFLPALKIICERGYHPEGRTWRMAGWRGLLTDILKKSERLRFKSWIKGEFDWDDALDLINFCGFYYRLRNEGKPWGEWGEPEQDADPMDNYPTDGKGRPHARGCTDPECIGITPTHVCLGR